MASTPNEGQRLALDRAWNWWKNPVYPFILQGYAGTGKTWLVQYLLELFDIADGRFELIAPTGKAAKVLTNKLINMFPDNPKMKARTIHKFLYQPLDKHIEELKEKLRVLHDELEKDEDFRRQEVEIEEQIGLVEGALYELGKKDPSFGLKALDPTMRPQLVICDETSMVSESIGKDLEDLKIPLIYIGDPFQLAPVKEKCIWNGRRPSAILSKIERQGEGSGIVIAAQAVRLGEQYYSGNGFQIHRRGNIQLKDYPSYDMVIVGTNKLRRKINHMMRSYLGYQTKYPVVGEKVICLHNSTDYGIMNGESFTITKINYDRRYYLGVTLKDSFDQEITVPCWKALFDDDSQGALVPRGFVHLTYAYARTAHKSQGSEDERVLVLDSWPGNGWDRWTYTAWTRARSHCDYVES
jgi:exodeoxyribonuclease-5